MLTNVGGTIANVLTVLGAKAGANPKTASWMTLVVAVLGLMGVSPEAIKAAITGVCAMLQMVAASIPG